MFTQKYVYGTPKLLYYSLIGKVKLSYDPFCRRMVDYLFCHNVIKGREV